MSLDHGAFEADQGGVQPTTLERQRRATVERQLELLGSSGGSYDLFGIGPDRSLLGRSASEPPRALPEGLKAEFARFGGLRSVNPEAEVVPALIEGRLVGDLSDPPTDLAVAMNGRLAGVGPPYRLKGEWRFAIPVPSRAPPRTQSRRALRGDIARRRARPAAVGRSTLIL